MDSVIWQQVDLIQKSITSITRYMLSGVMGEIVTPPDALIEHVDMEKTMKVASAELSEQLELLFPGTYLRVALQKVGKAPAQRYYLRFRQLKETLRTEDVIALAAVYHRPQLASIVEMVMTLNLLQKSWHNIQSNYTEVVNQVKETQQLRLDLPSER